MVINRIFFLSLLFCVKAAPADIPFRYFDADIAVQRLYVFALSKRSL